MLAHSRLSSPPLAMTLLLTLLLALSGQRAAWDALWESGKRVEALAAMVEALEASPEDRELRSALVERELEVSRFRAALEHAQGLGAEGRFQRARARYFLADYEAALPDLDPSDPSLILLRVESLRALGRLGEADALLPRVAALFGEADPRHALLVGRKLLREGELEAAAARFRAVLEVAPLEAEALFGLGRALVRAGQREEGLRILERHRELIPRLDALDFARRGLALAPRSAANQAALAEAWAGLREFDAGAEARCRAAFERALALASPDERSPVALRAARFEAEACGDLRAALQRLEAAMRVHDDVRLRVRAGDYRARLGELGAARAEYRAALELRPGDRAIEERLRELERGGR